MKNRMVGPNFIACYKVLSLENTVGSPDARPDKEKVDKPAYGNR